MGRRSSFSSRSSSKPSGRSSYAQAPPRPAQPAPQAQTQSPGLFGSMMGTMAQGMAFGAGSEVAHQAVRGMMGSNGHSAPVDQAQTPAQALQNQAPSCQMENSNFVECLKFNSNNITACQDYLNLLKTCESQNK